jgi:hypothetical protein
MFDYPRTQVLIGGFCTAGVSPFLLGDRQNIIGYVVLGLLLLCVLYQGYQMYPYTCLASQQVLTSVRPRPEARFSLFIANVLQENTNAEKHLEIVRAANPDILLAVETDTWWATRLETLDSEYAYTVKHPLSNCYGMLLILGAWSGTRARATAGSSLPAKCEPIRNYHRRRINRRRKAPIKTAKTTDETGPTYSATV